MRRMLSAAAAKLLQLQPLRHGLTILGGRIIPFFALTALQRNNLPGHKNNSYFLRTENQKLIAGSSNPALLFPPISAKLSSAGQVGHLPLRGSFYCTISLIVPAPTVWPPSRIANRNPFSIATGVISSMTKLTLSPGITISVPAGSSATPVTSVVRR
jgi:hypothetical protein